MKEKGKSGGRNGTTLMANNMHIVYQFQGMKLQLVKTNSDSSQNGSLDKFAANRQLGITDKHLKCSTTLWQVMHARTPTLLGKILHQLIEPLSHEVLHFQTPKKPMGPRHWSVHPHPALAADFLPR